MLEETITPNLLTLGIQPEEKINLTFETKNPGAEVCLRPVTMDFNYRQNYEGPILDAYEKALIDCMQGDHMLFWREDGWNFVGPSSILYWRSAKAVPTEMSVSCRYSAGSWGPDVSKIR